MHVEHSSPLVLYPILSASNRNFSFRALHCWKENFDALIKQESFKSESAPLKGSISLAGIAERVIIEEVPGDCNTLLASGGSVFGVFVGEMAASVLKIHSLVFKSGSTLNGHLSSLSQAMPLIESWAVRRGILEIQVQTPAVFASSFQSLGFHSPAPVPGAMDLTMLKKDVLPGGEQPALLSEEVSFYKESLEY